MMADVNRYGLKRSKLSEATEREVRQRCGFGCIQCGFAIVEYHHFDPPFKDACEHRAEGITLLCKTCHGRVGQDFDDAFIRKCNQNPKCKQIGFAHSNFIVGSDGLTFKLGGAWFKHTDVILFDDKPLISFSFPEQPGEPILLNAILYDKDEREILKIVNNIWKAGAELFDVEMRGGELIIRSKLYHINLRLRAVAEKEIAIDQLNMQYQGYIIQVKQQRLIVKDAVGSELHLDCPNILTALRLSSRGGIRVG